MCSNVNRGEHCKQTEREATPDYPSGDLEILANGDLLL